MKKLIIIVVLNCILILTWSQKKRLQELICVDNTHFSLGDSIQFGLPSYSDLYEYIKSEDNSTSTPYYKMLKGDKYGTKHKITRIYKDYSPIWDTSEYIIEVGNPTFLKYYSYYININQAIRNGEIILTQSPLKEYNKTIVELSDSIAFLYKIKQSQKPTIDYALEYIYRYNNEVYRKYKQDEFELDNQKQIASVLLSNLKNTISDTTIYFIDIKLEFGNYDFSSQSFPITGYSNYYTITDLSMYGEFSSINLVLINQKEQNVLQIDKSIANSFIKRKKDNYGNVNREIFARVYFKNGVVPIDAPIRESYSENKNKNFIFGVINRIEFFDSKNRTYNYIGQININK